MIVTTDLITERRFQCARTFIQSYLPFRLTASNIFAREEFSVKIKDFKHLLHANILINQIKLNVKQSNKYMAENALEKNVFKRFRKNSTKVFLEPNL